MRLLNTLVFGIKTNARSIELVIFFVSLWVSQQNRKSTLLEIGEQYVPTKISCKIMQLRAQVCN